MISLRRLSVASPFFGLTLASTSAGNLVFTSRKSWSPAVIWGANQTWGTSMALVKAANIVRGTPVFKGKLF